MSRRAATVPGIQRPAFGCAEYTPAGCGCRVSTRMPKKLEGAILEPGTFFGEMPILSESMRSAQAEAIDDCTVCVASAMSQRPLPVSSLSRRRRAAISETLRVERAGVAPVARSRAPMRRPFGSLV
ncbi:MAG: cyclic nucleotide-binding domain-containing protein, partial [Chloroflexota bacterium]